jgi:HNH endonuclease
MNHYALNRRNGEPVRHRVFTDSYIKDGYRYVRIGHRHYEPEHRLVMERFLGRKLLAEEQVHHINGDITDNSPSNLLLMSRSEHMRIHARKILSDADVLAIRARYAAGGVSHQQLAESFNVTRVAILKVINRKTWNHI